MLLQPLLIAAVLSPVILAIELGREERSTRSYTAVVDGDEGLVELATEHLTAAGIRVRNEDDATLAVAGEDAHVAVLLSAGRGNDPAQVVLEQRADFEASRRASAVALRAIEEMRLDLSREALRAADVDPDAAQPLKISVEDATSASPDAARLTVASALPTLIAIQMFSLVSLAQQRLGTAKARRVLEPLLVLPVSRAAILLGTGLAAAVLGFLGASVVLVPLAALMVAGVGALTSSLAAPLTVVAALVFEIALLTALFVAAGTFVGSRTASGTDSTTLTAIIQTALILVLSLSVFVAEADVTVALAAIPVVGVLLVAREGAADGLAVAHVVTACASHIALTAALFRVSARQLGERRSVLRIAK